jgi:hypothetical protein
MTQLEQVEGDLRFVRGALTASERTGSPAAIYFLWAAAALVGFSLVDFRRDLLGAYWSVVGPAGFALSWFLGWRHARRSGQLSIAKGGRQALHWGGMLVVIALAAMLPGRGVVSWDVMNALILLILAFGYFTAGVHGDREMLWIGVLMAAGYVLVSVVPAYAWTAVGVALAVALAVAGLRRGRGRETAG